MNIVMNEVEYAQNAIDAHFMDKDAYNTVNRVARYYRSQSGTDAEAIRKTEEYILRCDSYANLLAYRQMIESSVRQYKTKPLVEIDSIKITQKEMDTIAGISFIQVKMVLFTMLCLAKYWNMINEKNNNWVNRGYRDIFNLANIYGNEQRRVQIMRDIYDGGFCSFSNRFDNENSRVEFVDDESMVVLEISDFRNLGNQYRMAIGQPYLECASCGLVVRRTGRNQKYCCNCAPEEYKRKAKKRRRMNLLKV